MLEQIQSQIEELKEQNKNLLSAVYNLSEQLNKTRIEQGQHTKDIKNLTETVNKEHFIKKVTDYQVRSEKKLSILKKKVYTGEKVRVCFLNMDASKFAEKSIYFAMLKNNIFEPFVLSIGRDAKRLGLESEADYFRNAGYVVYDAKDIKNTGRIDAFEYLKPDIVFCSEPTNTGWCRWDVLSWNYLTCIVPYSIEVIDNNKYHINNLRWMLSWLFFTPTSQLFEEFPNHSYFPINVRYFGYPKMDAYLNPKKPIYLNKFSETAPIVIYAPHWSIKKSNQLATFHLYARFFLDLAKQNPSINWVFKPHPALVRRLYELEKERKKTGISIAMTVDEYKEYIEEWNNLPNAVYMNSGDYFWLFKKSACLIMDCGSFVGEWLPSGNPCIYLLNPDDSKQILRFRSNGQRILNSYYLAKSQNEILSLFEEVVLKGRDEKKKEREQVCQELFPVLGTSGESIVEYLENIITTGDVV